MSPPSNFSRFPTARVCAHARVCDLYEVLYRAASILSIFTSFCSTPDVYGTYMHACHYALVIHTKQRADGTYFTVATIYTITNASVISVYATHSV